MRLEDIAIVLSRPAESGNVGAVCRAMKNMGLSRLRLVSPAELDEKVIRARAVHAADLWETAEVFDSLETALSDCAIAVGITRRSGHKRKALTLNPEALSAYLKARNGLAALVFGNERTGLESDELACCNARSHIPSHAIFPSLNISHAVQIYAYQLFRVLGSFHEPPGTWIPMNQAELSALTEQITDSLASLGFYKHPGRIEQERFLQDIFSRAGISIREGAYIKNIFAKTVRLSQDKK